MIKLEYQMGECLQKGFDQWTLLDDVWLTVDSNVQDELNEVFSNEVFPPLIRIRNMYRDSMYNRIDLGQAIGGNIMERVKAEYSYGVYYDVGGVDSYLIHDIGNSIVESL